MVNRESMKNVIKRLVISRFARFLAVGIINTFAGLVTMYSFLNLLGFNYWVSTFIGNTVGAIVSYFLNKKFTFKSKASIKNSYWKFIVVILSCYAFSYWASLFLLEMVAHINQLTISAKLVDNLAIVIGTIIYTLSNFVGQKYFVFLEKSREVGERSEREFKFIQR